MAVISVADPERGFQLLAKAPAHFELKTKIKKRSSTFIFLSQQYVMNFHCIISTRTTVIENISIRLLYKRVSIWMLY